MNEIIKIGNFVEVTKSGGGHNYTIGEKYVVFSVDNGNQSCGCKSLDGSFKGNNLSFCNLKICPLTKEDLNKEIQDFEQKIEDTKQKIEDTKQKIAWMDENGLDEFNPQKHKVFKVLEAYENKELNLMDKANIIAELIK